MVSYKKEDMVYWYTRKNGTWLQVTRKTWYTGKLQERRHGILVSYKKEDMVTGTRKNTWYTGKLQERRHGILVSYKKEDMVYW